MIIIRCDLCDWEIKTVEKKGYLKIIDDVVEENDELFHRDCYEANNNQSLTRWI